MYNPQEIEAKWQKIWEESGTGIASTDTKKKKLYVLDMWPYPSGDGLHIGHTRIYTASDVVSRVKRMQGFEVLHPTGWDAFGLPAENYAIKHGVHPKKSTAENIANAKRQMKRQAFSYDWSREVSSTDPEYYKWTQWIFVQLFNKGLAYEATIPINWCPKDKTGLANEEVIQGKCDRCGTVVEKRNMRQWVLKITEYADRLLTDLEPLQWPEGIKAMQRNWIGRSEGAKVRFLLAEEPDHFIEVFTTRPDTLFGATYMVLAPEHEFVERITTHDQKEAVQEYVNAAKHKSDMERTDLKKDKTGVFSGSYAINPVNGQKIPIWIADYVLATYGTGAIMAVPAHDERDFDFAKKFDLPIKQVVAPKIIMTGESTPQEDKGVSKKNVVTAIIQHPHDNTYLVLEWPSHRLGFVGGGIEEGESAEDAVRREIIEETGFTDFIITEAFPIQFYGYGYKSRKDINCFDLDQGFIVQLQSLKQQDMHTEDQGNHVIRWVDKKDVAQKITLDHHLALWDWFQQETKCYTGQGLLINSEGFSELDSSDARNAIVEELHKHGQAENKIQFKLRDWVFSRQRYWGEPIPIIHCEKCGTVAVPEDQLPVTLPEVEKYEPTGTGESPLASVTEWVNTTCPNCAGPAKRETNTMPQWAGSSWYFLRFADPHNASTLASKEALDYWMPVDIYVGGAEHAVLHLLYARFWHKFLFDLGLVPGSEPFTRLESVGIVGANAYKDEQGRWVHYKDIIFDGDTAFHKETHQVLAPEVEKMSKSKGNVISPDEMCDKYGADTLRVYSMFLGDWHDMSFFDLNGIEGSFRFLKKAYALLEKKQSESANPKLKQILAQSILKISKDIDTFNFNTAISQLMILVNTLGEQESISAQDLSILVKLLAPFAPHIAEEMWQKIGNSDSVFESPWPVAKEADAQAEEVEIVIQVNGKVRGKFTVPRGASREELESLAKAQENVAQYLSNGIIKAIVVPDAVVNFVVKA